MMAKNEIKMLLLGAGESGKVPHLFLSGYLVLTIPPVDRAEADEAHPQWRIQRPGAGLVQGNYILKYCPVNAVS
jgi:hypothetical protein